MQQYSANILRFILMERPIRFSLSLASTAALGLASLPLAIRPAVAQETPAAAAEEPKADTTEVPELGVMGVNLKDAVKFNWGFQGALQGAGTPNQAGIGAFIPLHVGSNSVALGGCAGECQLQRLQRLQQHRDNKGRWYPPLPGKLTPLHFDHQGA